MISPSQAIRKILIDQNLAVDSPDDDWRCVLTRLPDGAGVGDNILAVTEIEGGIGGRFLSTSEIIAQPRVRILCRATTYFEGYSKMMQITAAIDAATHYQVTIGDDTAILHSTSRSSGIVSGGLDATMRRYHFSIDYEVSLR